MNPTHDRPHRQRPRLRRACGAICYYGAPQALERRRPAGVETAAAVSVPAPVSTPTVARWLGVHHSTMLRLARRWYPDVGRGHHIRLGPVDVMVCRALLTIHDPQGQRLGQLAELAIRRRPARWLVLSHTSAATYETETDAARALAGPQRPACCWVIDLWPPAWTCPSDSGVAAA